MKQQDLNKISSRVKWLITKRSGKAAMKALTIGSESLEKTLLDIAAMYRLTDEEVQSIWPSIAEDIQRQASWGANALKSLSGVTAVKDGAQIAKAGSSALKTGRVGKSLVLLATRGPKVAKTFANTGKIAGKASPVVLGLTVAWTVGSTGWFAYHASNFNAAALALKRKGSEPDEKAG